METQPNRFHVGHAGEWQGVVLVLQQDEALGGDLLHQVPGLVGGLLGDLALALGGADEVGHGAQTDQVGDENGRQRHNHSGGTADGELLASFQLHAGDDGHDPQNQDHAQRNEIALAGLQYADDVVHADR